MNWAMFLGGRGGDGFATRWQGLGRDNREENHRGTRRLLANPMWTMHRKDLERRRIENAEGPPVSAPRAGADCVAAHSRLEQQRRMPAAAAFIESVGRRARLLLNGWSNRI